MFGIDADGRGAARAGAPIACDAVAMSAGWNPTVHLWSQAGGKVRYDEQLTCLVPEHCRQRVRIVGAANAEFDLSAAIESGVEAGRDAAAAAVSTTGNEDAAARRKAASGPSAQRRINCHNAVAFRRTPGGPRDRQWVDFQHDVTVADVELAVRENYVSIEHLKLYTTNGMSIDQGKTSNLNALMLLAELTGRPVTAVGTTTYRPVRAGHDGAIAGANGELFLPSRYLPAHRWHAANGARFDDYGGWRRPAYYEADNLTRARRSSVRFESFASVLVCSTGRRWQDRGPMPRSSTASTSTPSRRCSRQVPLRPSAERERVVIDDGVRADRGPLLSARPRPGRPDRGMAEEWHQANGWI
jgi:hypothetical protein